MADPRGFLKFKRKKSAYRPVKERVADYKEASILRLEDSSKEQASRCMDCGTPFCHWGCPIGNHIPEWNNLMFQGKWEKAFQLLDATNNMPEITGRLCPALCEYACVLGINDDAITIRENELDVIELAFKHGLIKPRPPKQRTGKRVAVVGSGPAGLSCAAQLNKAGHNVVVFEKSAKVGGILRYGIPDFKLDKKIIDRRLKLWQKEGIEFKTSVEVGEDYPSKKLLDEFDAVCLTGGSSVPRDLNIEGRELAGIHFAMDYLVQSNQRVAGEKIPKDNLIDAQDKKVVIIGGGDTGADCVGTANRQGASKIVQLEVLPKPPVDRTDDFPWPTYPMLLKTSTSHEEGADRQWSILTKKFSGEGVKVEKLHCIQVEFGPEKDAHNRPIMKEVKGSEFEIEADLVILAVGFIHPQHGGLLNQLGLEFDVRGNVKTDEDFQTSKKKIFCAGDMRRGQSLIVWAVYEGREAARAIDGYLSK